MHREQIPAVQALEDLRSSAGFGRGAYGSGGYGRDYGIQYGQRVDRQEDQIVYRAEQEITQIPQSASDLTQTKKYAPGQEVRLVGRFQAVGEHKKTGEVVVHFVSTGGTVFRSEANPDVDSPIMFGEPCMIRGQLTGRRSDPILAIHIDEIVELTEL